MSVSKYGRKLNYLGFLANEPQLCEVSNATYEPMPEFNFLTSHKLQVQAQVSLQYLGYHLSGYTILFLQYNVFVVFI